MGSYFVEGDVRPETLLYTALIACPGIERYVFWRKKIGAFFFLRFVISGVVLFVAHVYFCFRLQAVIWSNFGRVRYMEVSSFLFYSDVCSREVP